MEEKVERLLAEAARLRAEAEIKVAAAQALCAHTSVTWGSSSRCDNCGKVWITKP